MPRKKKFELICTRHQTIISTAEETIELIDKNKELKLKDKRLLKKHMKIIIDEANEALTSGQNMEDRLQEYHEAISDLGFKRK